MRDWTNLLSKLPPGFQIPASPSISITLPNSKEDKLRKNFQALDKDKKEEYLKRLSKPQWRWMYQHPDIFLFDRQVILGDDWMYYLLQCGRGFGKTHAGAAWVAKKIREGAKAIGLMGPSYDDVEKTMVPFILSWFLPDEVEDPAYTNYEVRFKNGARIYCYSSQVEKKGPNLEYLWCDEIAAWCKDQPDKIKERYDDMVRAVRIGKHPQTVITSTPKNHPFFLHFQKQIDGYQPNYRLAKGSMFDNPTLSDAYIISQIQDHAYSTRGRQELFGELITETPGAYWTHEQIDQCRAPIPAPTAVRRNKLPSNAVLMGQIPASAELPPIYLIRIVIGFDPNAKKGRDECGIIVAALYSNKQAYILQDASGQYNPPEYAKKISDLYQQYQAAAVVVETNNGGDTIEYALRTVNANLNFVKVHTMDGKTTRAEHCSSLYARGKVHHTQVFRQLEDQMCSFNINYTKSPDRLDALGHALTELFWPSNHQPTRSVTNLPSLG